MSSLVLRADDPARTAVDLVVVGVLAPASGAGAEQEDAPAPVLAPGAEPVAEAYGGRLGQLMTQLGITGKTGQTVTIPTAGVLEAPLLMFVGLGADPTPTAVRRAAGAAARAVAGATSVALALPTATPAELTAVVEGFWLGRYSFDVYRGAPSDAGPTEVVVLTPHADQDATRLAAEQAQVVAAAVARTRDWVNTPPGDLTPPALADAVTEAATSGVSDAASAAVTVTVFDEEVLAARGCGGILGVGRGSSAPPRMVHLSYTPDGATRHLAMVGKGITYDSGGLSIKPAASMTTMKMDMAGAAAVVNATLAIAELGLPVRVTTYAPMAENMISGSATRPGDVLTMYGGTSVEVLNTDAEGRLILADALGHAVEAEPDLLVDVATLTGACVVALGDRVSGLFGDDDAVAEVARAAERAGEAVWPMPIPEEMVEKVRGNSKIADLAQHNTERWGGASYAAAFLQQFVGGVPWAHLDIAGPAYNDKGPYGHVTTGGTGVAVATLVELARALAEDIDPGAVAGS